MLGNALSSVYNAESLRYPIKFSFNICTDLITQLHYTDLIYLKRKVFIPRPYLGKQMRYKLQNKTSIRREKTFLIRVFNHKIRKITQYSDLPT